MVTFCIVVSNIAGFYRRVLPDENHVLPSVRTSDIIIGTIASMTEPDGMMWFPRFNAGETAFVSTPIFSRCIAKFNRVGTSTRLLLTQVPQKQYAA